MAIQRLPEAARTPSVARAAVSPSAIAVTGAGVALGLVAHLPVLAAAVIGAGCWGIRVGVGAAVARHKRRRPAGAEPIDPYAVPDPWRSFVSEALNAQTRFDQAVARCRPGPLQDHLREVGARVGDGVRECWRVAHLGASLSAAAAGLDPTETSRQLRDVQDRRGRPGSSAALDESEAALATRLQAARRIADVVQRTTDRLRVLTAQLDEAVASAVELSLSTNGGTAATPVAGSVETVVREIEALRQAIEETNTRPMTGTATTS